MPGAVDLIAVLTRLLHICSACLLTGTFGFLVLVGLPASRAAGPAMRGSFDALDRRLLALAGLALGIAMGTGLLDLARHAFVATRGAAAGFAPQTMGTLLVETRYGDVWLVRHALWLLLAALLLLRAPDRDRLDWLALRLAGLTLAAAALVVGAASGHAASVPERTGSAIAVDALHLLAAGLWAGALVPLALFLTDASAIPAAVAVRHFSTLGLVSVGVMLVSGTYAAVEQVGSVPALVGTAYGRWLLAKLALLLPLLGIAFVNRAHLRPGLERAMTGSSETDARIFIGRLRRLVLLEALLVAAILVAVAILGLTTPARHDPIEWPLPFRFAWDSAKDLPGAWLRVIIGSLLAILGVVATLLAIVRRRRWWRPALVGGAVAAGLGLVAALPPLVVDAYPTTYARPTAPYTAASIVRGRAVYMGHCATCHGSGGAGDGLAATSATSGSVGLIGKRTADRTAGELFWLITRGVTGSAMPGFADRLSPEQRWDVVNFVRTLAAAEEGRNLAPLVSPRPTIVAPDLAYTTGVAGERSLRDHRGRNVVLLVLFRVPESLERLSRLGRRHIDFRLLGAEVVAVPLQGAGDVYRAVGSRPVLFPIVIGGAEQAAATYGLFRRDLSLEGRRSEPSMPLHMELLIDRQGYLRARWLPPGSPDAPGGWSDLQALFKEVERLSFEPSSAPTPGEHIH